MGINKKGKRKIIYNEKQYIWDVSLDCDSPYYCLNILSTDKKMILCCPIGLQTSYVICKGTEFKKKKTSGCWKRYKCPVEIPKTVTPKVVLEIIKWAEEDNGAIIVEWDGKDIVL